MLTSLQAKLLEVLSEDSGLTTGQVSELAAFSYGGTKRMRSSAVRSWLNELHYQGLVSYGNYILDSLAIFD